MEDEISSKKSIARLEHQIQSAKIKLSVARRDNANTKKAIDETRKDKVMHMSIVNNLQKSLENYKKRAQVATRDIAVANDKKHRVQIDVTNMKHRMVRDMEDFSRELNQAKQSIQVSQEGFMESFRDRLSQSYVAYDESSQMLESFFNENAQNSTMRDSAKDTQRQQKNISANQKALITEMLTEVSLASLEDLLSALRASEEQCFTLYSEIHTKNKELEKLDLENKHLEQDVKDKVQQLENLEGHNDKLKQELEQHIATIQKSIAKYDADYTKNMDVLQSISDSLMNLLKNVADDEEALDQQLLSTGITDRNIDDFLGLVEQRIDDLIQMSKAAMHHPLRKEDFSRTIYSDKNAPTIFAPTLPTLHDGADDDDDDNAPVQIQPINIAMLKEYMNKKVKSTASTKKNGPPSTKPTGGAGAGYRSNASISANSS